MKAQVVVLPNGSFALMIQEGTFEEGEVKIKKVLEDLKAQGIVIASVGKVEAHRHGEDQAVKVQDRTKVNFR